MCCAVVLDKKRERLASNESYYESTRLNYWDRILYPNISERLITLLDVENVPLYLLPNVCYSNVSEPLYRNQVHPPT